MNKNLIARLLFLILPILCSAQNRPGEDTYEKMYDWRIRQENLYGVYIPKDVSDAIIHLNRLTDEKSKAKFKDLTEDAAAHKLFFSLGRWMSYNWSFYDGSRLSVHLRNLGIYHPDDMARFLIIVFHRSLSKKPLEIKILIQQFQEKAEKEKQERLKNGDVIFDEKRKVAKPPSEKNGQ